MPDPISSQHRADYALGYIALGLLPAAEAELTAVSAHDQSTPAVLGAWVELHLANHGWAQTIAAARQLVDLAPAEEHGWIAWAYALRELQRTAEAREVLLRAEPLHGVRCALLHFNLACYECLLGDLAEARRRLDQAIALDSSYVVVAAADPDLQALRQRGGA